MALLQKLETLRPKFAEVAQSVVDSWDPDDEFGDFGGGGVCDEIASEMESVIGSSLPDAQILEGGHDGDDHAWLIVVEGQEAAGVNIPADVYETGGGYSWTKKPEARVDPDDVVIWKIDKRDVVASQHVATKWLHEGKFVFNGRTYDIKISHDGRGAVVYQKVPKCVFVKNDDGWLFQAGSKAIYGAAMNYLKQRAAFAAKIASEEHDDARLQPGPAFHLQPDGTWEVKEVPPAVTRDARFSGFLAIEGYWCMVFELNGKQWAQKAAGDIPEDSPMAKLSAIAARVAHLSR